MINIREYSKKIHSQRGEDGMIDYVMKTLGIEQGTCCEFGAWDGKHLSNVRNLIEQGWTALLLEGNNEKFQELKRNIANYPMARGIEDFVTLEREHSLDYYLDMCELTELDVLSIDIDSYDYWIWANTTNRAKLVVIEYNSAWNESVTVPYETPFQEWNGTQYYGASALALKRLADIKGYDLIGVVPYTNLFFIRSDLNEDLFSIVDLNYTDYLRTLKRKPLTEEQYTKLIFEPEKLL